VAGRACGLAGRGAGGGYGLFVIRLRRIKLSPASVNMLAMGLTPSFAKSLRCDRLDARDTHRRAFSIRAAVCAWILVVACWLWMKHTPRVVDQFRRRTSGGAGCAGIA